MRNFPAFMFGLGCLIFALFIGSLPIGYIFGVNDHGLIRLGIIALGIFAIWFSFKR
ncbi:hypothetical protein J4422_00410 [Candidatus Pacearchaeota archaeon]|nr:hypothetical protein [Candidatus Pacearchaeota archaeon]